MFAVNNCNVMAMKTLVAIPTWFNDDEGFASISFVGSFVECMMGIG